MKSFLGALAALILAFSTFSSAQAMNPNDVLQTVPSPKNIRPTLADSSTVTQSTKVSNNIPKHKASSHNQKKHAKHKKSKKHKKHCKKCCPR